MQMFLEFNTPKPVVAAEKSGYAIYVRDGGTFENDIWCVVHVDGSVRHYRSDQIRFYPNGTFDIEGEFPAG